MSRVLTLENIPEEVESALQAKARAEGKTINDVAVEALAAAAGVSVSPTKKRDLSDIAGTWVEDPEFDKIMREQDRIDPEMWK
ncbi:MAG TPA: hypothetical protein VG722_11415 [Tepidisphaeraceae bacterium]|nr:hypothetical protein [Tepidisphaeraceae bacterium]